MRDVTRGTSALVSRTITLLFTICAVPFAANVLGQNGSVGGVAVILYSGVNAAALLAQLHLDQEARRLTPADKRIRFNPTELVCDLVAYMVAAPAAYFFAGHGVIALTVCLVVAGRVAGIIDRRHTVTRGARNHSAHDE